jgi:hypothetical protein
LGGITRKLALDPVLSYSDRPGQEKTLPLMALSFPHLFALHWFGIAIIVTAQRSCFVKYALMGISFFALLWFGTFVLLLK